MSRTNTKQPDGRSQIGTSFSGMTQRLSTHRPIRCLLEHIYTLGIVQAQHSQARPDGHSETPYASARAQTIESDGEHLLLILLALLVDDVVEAELVDALGGGDNAQPGTELLLLEVLLGPAHRPISTLYGSNIQERGRTGT